MQQACSARSCTRAIMSLTYLSLTIRFCWVYDNWPQQTDHESTDRKQTDSEQRRLAEKSNPKYIFTIPRAILPKPLLCDEITATLTKSSLRGQFICGQFVAVSWLGLFLLVQLSTLHQNVLSSWKVKNKHFLFTCMLKHLTAVSDS